MIRLKPIIRNDQGYALVTVLLIITVFMMLAIAFMGQSTNSMKQNSIIEEKSQSVALAEMGVSYFEHDVRNVYESNHQKVVNQVMLQREADRLILVYKSDEEYKQMAINLLKEILIRELDPSLMVIDDENSASFEIKNDTIYKSSKGINIDFDSFGNDNGKTTTIHAAMTIDFSNWMSAVEDVNIILPIFKENEKEINSVSISSNIEYPSSVLFEDIVTINGNHELEIQGDALFNDLLILHGNPSKLTVHGNAYFSTKIKKNENHDADLEELNICIKGKVYLLDGTDYKPYPNLINSCSNQKDDSPEPSSISITVTY